MKITVVFILFSSLGVFASGTYAQTKKLTLNMEDVKVEDVLSNIEKQSEFYFFVYSEKVIDAERKVSVKLEKQNIEAALNSIFAGTDVVYSIRNRLIVLSKPGIDTDISLTSNEIKNISGRVTDSEGFPLPGVTVIIKGTTTGAVTDEKGDYQLSGVSKDAVLQFSFVGMKSREVVFTGQERIDIIMEEESIGLEEVVAIGYGVQKKSDLTGAVASVKSEELNKMAVSNPAEALQGKMAGVNVTSIGGAPGAGVNVLIRGVGTINNNSPLFVIDGVPGSFYMLNPQDIESVEVLKDGAAAAIYGTEAANGVVLVTTKKGKQGKMRIDLNAKYGVQKLGNTAKMTNSAEYIKVATMMYDNAKNEKPDFLSEKPKYDTDWFDEVSRVAPQQEYNLNISGGAKNINYYVSAGWLDQEGTLIGTDFTKASLRSNIDFSGSRIKGGIKMAYSETNSDELSYSLKETYEILPLIPVYDESQPSGFGAPNKDLKMPGNNNPVGVDYFRNSTYSDQYFSFSSYLNFEIIDGVNYRLEGGLNNSNRHSHLSFPSYNVNPYEEVLYPQVSEDRSNWREWNINNILTWEKTIDKHDFTLMAAYTAKEESNDWMGAGISGYKKTYSVVEGELSVSEEPTGFLDEGFDTLDSGLDGESSVSGSRNKYTRASVLGRLNYSYDSRYLFQFSIRRDGSSKFGSDSRYGWFPALAAGWRINEESFMEDVDLFSNLKLRASYAKLGNEGSLGYYNFLPTITSSTTEFLSYSKGRGETIWLGSIAREMENKDLRWETTYTLNIGLDFGLFDGKINGAVNYYNNNTEDMLVRVPIPPSSGMQTPVVNFGEVENSGFELELGYDNNYGDFKYNISGTISTTDNEVVKLGSENESIYGEALYFSEHYPNQTRKGYPIGGFFLYQADGIFQNVAEVEEHNKKGKEEPLQPDAAPGDIRFKDVNNDGYLNDDDIIYSGTGIPKLNYSLAFDAQYKGFDLSILLYGASGHKIYSGNRYYYESMRAARNFYATTIDAWTPDNRDTDMPRAVFGDPNANSRESTRFLEKGNFMRVKNIQLGYTFPGEVTSKLNISKARIYISGQNLFTFTNYSGQDPEVGRSSVFNPGLDRSLYPISKLYLAGVQISF